MNNKIYLFGLLSLFGFVSFLHSKEDVQGAETINKTVAIIYGGDEIEVVTKVDCERNPLGQGNISPEEAVLERLMYLETKKLQISVDDDAIETYLLGIQTQHDISREQLAEIFRQAGYTMGGGREHFRRAKSVERLLEYKIKTKIVVSKEDIEEYYKQHPIKVEAVCVVQIGVIPFSSKESVQEQQRRIENDIKNKKTLKNVKWSDPLEMKKSSVASNMLYLFDQQVGYVSKPETVEDGFKIFRLKNSTPEGLKPLSERYSEILNELRLPLYKKLLEDYKEELLQRASISILDEGYFSKDFLKSLEVNKK